MVTQCWNILEHEYHQLITSPRSLPYLTPFQIFEHHAIQDSFERMSFSINVMYPLSIFI
jgi:hypothetical protein